MHDHSCEESRTVETDLAATVRRRRESLALRQSDVADLADCSVRFVHTLENGKRSLRLDKVVDVLEVLGLGLFVGPAREQLHSLEKNPESGPESGEDP
jgi:HTH-type transcriptional regulator / antitoxin HipB